MGNALWLFFSVPVWYGETIGSPLSAGPLTAIAAAGIVSLAFGVVGGLIQRERGLLIFILSPAVSQLLLIVAGLLRGAFRPDPNHLIVWILGTFLLIQIVGAAYLVWRLAYARWPAAALTIFTSSYALFAAFVAAMAFGESWL